MSRGPQVAFVLRLGGAGRTVLLDRLARLVEAAPAGDGLLVEGPLGEGSLTVIPNGAALADGVRAIARDLPGSITEGVPGPPPAPRRPGWEERVGRLEGPIATGEPVARPGADAGGGGPSRGPSDARPLARIRFPLDPGLWLAVQSHWFSSGGEGIFVATRYWLAAPPTEGETATVRVTAALRSARGAPVRVRWRVPSGRDRRRWRDGKPSARDRFLGRVVPWEEAGQCVELLPSPPFPSAGDLARHLVVLGASGSGKTSLLARIAAERIGRGEAVVLFDLHGDLAPAVLGLTPATARRRIVAVDPSVGEGTGPGVPVLGGEAEGERAVAHVVAALKRLSADNSEVYWGFRLERIYETVVRAAQEDGGSLLDVYDLLTNPDRREATRLSTRLDAVERFLAELPAILRRNPEYLGPAAARLARIALSPRLAALLAPGPGASLPLSDLLAAGRPLLVRLPMAELGPEASGFAATLLLTRLYLELARRTAGGRVLLLLDEVQALSPRLVSEVVSEGRKFGVEAVLASQFSDRLAPELRAAAAGAVGAHLVFRLPAPAARAASEWAGLSPAEAAAILPALPDGCAMLAGGDTSPGPRLVRGAPVEFPRTLDAWRSAVEATRRERVDPALAAPPSLPGEDEAILLALYAAERPLAPAELERRLSSRSRELLPRLLERVGALERRRLVLREDGGWSLTAAGARILGASAEHGSTLEGAEHRQLLLEAFRIFARHGERLTLLRQGRFDTRLPDGHLGLLSDGPAPRSPAELFERLERRRREWAWRCFGGRDVHVEAEVSGAERTERIRRDYRKAERAGAHPLFLVADARRARRIREVLTRLGVDRRGFTVWTLPRARGRHGLDLPSAR